MNNIVFRKRMRNLRLGYFHRLGNSRKLSNENSKLPNVLLLSHNQKESATKLAETRLMDSLLPNSYDLKIIDNLQEFIHAPWQDSVKAVILWCKNLNCETSSIVKEAFILISSYLQKGGKVLVFENNKLTLAYFQPVLNNGYAFNPNGCCVHIAEKDFFTIKSKQIVYMKTFMDHKGAFFKLNQEENSSYFASKLTFDHSSGCISASLLPLLETDGIYQNDPNYALKILLRSIGLECKVNNSVQKCQTFSNIGIVNSTSKYFLNVFKTSIEKQGNNEFFLNTVELNESSQPSRYNNRTNKTTQLDVYDPKLKYPFFDWSSFSTNLSTCNYGQFAVHFDVVESTMTVFDNVDLWFPETFTAVVIANQQLKGKGRGGNKWLSPAGCAMFTLTMKTPLQSELGRKPSLVQHLMSVAVVHGIRSIDGLQDVNIRLKWPNDIYFGEELIKLGGILVQSSFARNCFTFKIGCGININNDEPLVSINTILKNNYLIDVKLSCEQVIARILSQFERLMNNYQNGNSDEFFHLYYKYWVHQDQIIEYKKDKNDIKMTGKIIGIDENGFLQVKTECDVISLHPDGNSFDVLKNLIQPKH